MKYFLLPGVLILLSFSNFTYSQNTFSFNCARDTTISCSAQCVVLKSTIPNIRGLSNTYVVNPISGNATCFRSYVSPATPGTATNISIDDEYTPVIPIGFSFPFFGSVYTKLVTSSNGYLSFDSSRAGLFSHYAILNSGGGLSASTGTGQDLPTPLYDRALIMGPYHDLDPGYSTSPTEMIKYETVGVAPHRRWVLTYYKVPLFYSGSCDQLIQNTSQIILYESLGIVEVFIYDQQQCPQWNLGHAMIGMQDMNRTSGIMAPNRAASSAPWGTPGMNESWRFTPSSGPSLYRDVTLYDLAGNIVSFGDTTTGTNGSLDVTFQNVCPPFNGTTSYVIKSRYATFNNPNQFIFGTDTIRVSRGAGITATTTTTQATCANGNAGIITVNVTAGTGPFQYSIDNGVTYQSSNTFTKPPGTYTILIRTVGATCTASTTATVSAGPSPLSATNVTTQANCSNNNIGTITITVSGGAGPFQYSIDNGVTYQSSNVFNKPAGTYTILIRSTSTTCTAITAGTITLGATTITGQYIVTPVRCNGGNDGSLTINAAGGVPPYQYSVNGGGAYQTSNVFSLTAGSYNVRIKDNGVCTKDTVMIIGQPSALVASATSANATCSPTPDGSIVVTAGGGTNPYLYSINGTTFQSGNNFTVVTGSYIVTIKDNNNCLTTVNTIVGLTNTLTLIKRTDTTICAGDSVRLTTISNASQFTWTPATGLNSTTIASPAASPFVPTTYVVTAQLGSCIKKDSIRISINPSPTVSAGPDVTIVAGDITVLQGVSSAGNYLWTPSTGLNANNIANPTAKPDTTTRYKLSTANTFGCRSSASVLVTVLPYCLKPNGAFTPNGDGIYDTWFVTDGTACLSNVEVHVFNRYGNKVFESSNYRNDWKGTYQGQSLPIGTYYYVIKYTLINKRVIVLKGNVTILR